MDDNPGRNKMASGRTRAHSLSFEGSYRDQDPYHKYQYEYQPEMTYGGGTRVGSTSYPSANGGTSNCYSTHTSRTARPIKIPTPPGHEAKHSASASFRDPLSMDETERLEARCHNQRPSVARTPSLPASRTSLPIRNSLPPEPRTQLGQRHSRTPSVPTSTSLPIPSPLPPQPPRLRTKSNQIVQNPTFAGLLSRPRASHTIFDPYDSSDSNSYAPKHSPEERLSNKSAPSPTPQVHATPSSRSVDASAPRQAHVFPSAERSKDASHGSDIPFTTTSSRTFPRQQAPSTPFLQAPVTPLPTQTTPKLRAPLSTSATSFPRNGSISPNRSPMSSNVTKAKTWKAGSPPSPTKTSFFSIFRSNSTSNRSEEPRTPPEPRLSAPSAPIPAGDDYDSLSRCSVRKGSGIASSSESASRS
ncbi:hypothetical protein BT69DRAFT_575492 [Atractiella rhizophila]|nr:hypothetical protein BT69DRAFT_575492 [Atractiella rhizophila]